MNFFKYCCIQTRNFYSHHQLKLQVPRTCHFFSLRFKSNDNSSSFTEKNQAADVVSTSNDERKLIQLELSILYERGKEVPNPDLLTKENWDQLFQLSKTARIKFYRHLLKLQKTVEDKQIKKQAKPKLREIFESLEPKQEHPPSTYKLGKLSFLLRINRSTMNIWRNNRLRQAMQYGEKIIFDCSYDQHMNFREAAAAAIQTQETFAANRKHREPFDLHFCNVDFNSHTMKRLESLIPTMRNIEFPLNLHEASYLDLFPNEQLTYLTPNCQNDLEKYDPDMIYIIGALVETRNQGQLSLAKAKKSNLKMARLPLDKYLQWGLGQKTLTLDEMIKIMLDLKKTRNWNDALKHVPNLTQLEDYRNRYSDISGVKWWSTLFGFIPQAAIILPNCQNCLTREWYFHNPYEDYNGGPVQVNENYVRNLIIEYVATISAHTNPAKAQRNQDKRGDLYVGNAGIAYMFLRLHQSQQQFKELQPLLNAQLYINDAKIKALSYAQSRSRDERCAFLCGNAGIYSVAAITSFHSNNLAELTKDLQAFGSGYEACKPINFSKYGSDEILVGRAGYLSGIYWLNKQLKPEPFNEHQITELCQVMIDSGRRYAAEKGSPFPLMYQYHGTEYLGAAHGLCAILHMILESPWFKRDSDSANFSNISKTKLEDIKKSIDAFVGLQNEEGNFPCAMEDLSSPTEHPLVHWCHGAPGAIYLLIKSYIVFKEEKYLNSCRRAADLIWHYGLLKKGPGICHGVAGNGYVFLVMYRLTGDIKYLYRATKFAEFLQSSVFLQRARTPDCPFSLYEGLAGTVCFLVDLLEPNKSCFPFMDVF